jgi:hypothetical protein
MNGLLSSWFSFLLRLSWMTTVWRMLQPSLHDSSYRLPVTMEKFVITEKCLPNRWLTMNLFVVERMPLASCWLAVDFRPGSTIPAFRRHITILFHYLRLGRLSVLFPSGFPTKILFTFLFYSMRVKCPAHFIFLDFIIAVIFGAK